MDTPPIDLPNRHAHPMQLYKKSPMPRLTASPKAAALILAVSLFASGCNTTTFEHSFNPNTDLLTLKTFTLLPIPHPAWDEGATLILGRDDLSLEVAKAILESKGYQFAASGDVDFMVGIRAEVQLPKTHGKSGIPELAFGWEPRPPPHVTDQGYAQQIRDEKELQTPRGAGEGVEIYFIIEAFETKTTSLAWQGWAKSGSIASFKGDATKANIVSKILKNFPN